MRIFNVFLLVFLSCALCACFTAHTKNALMDTQVTLPDVAVPDECIFEKPIANGIISSPFGMRMHPILSILRKHQGIDIVAPMDTPVIASAPGKVVMVNTKESDFGLFVEIEHIPNIITRYAHLNTICVAKDDTISMGMPIGTVGNSGLSTGPHVHFEVRVNGKAIDPKPVLEEPTSPVGIAFQNNIDTAALAAPSKASNIQDTINLFISDTLAMF